MSITAEILGGAKVVDTSGGVLGAPLDLALSVSVTTWSRKLVTIEDLVSNQSVQFDSVSAGKVLILKSSGRITCKVNSSATAIPCHSLLVHTDQTTAGITSLTISNASGAAITVEVLVGG